MLQQLRLLFNIFRKSILGKENTGRVVDTFSNDVPQYGQYFESTIMPFPQKVQKRKSLCFVLFPQKGQKDESSAITLPQ